MVHGIEMLIELDRVPPPTLLELASVDFEQQSQLCHTVYPTNP